MWCDDYSNIESPPVLRSSSNLKELKIFLSEHRTKNENFNNISRDFAEYKRLENFLNKNENSWETCVKNNLMQESIHVCYTLEHYFQESTRVFTDIKILYQYGNNLTEPIFYEYLRRAGVITYNDAIYIDDFGNKIIRKESEGPSIHNDVYKINFMYCVVFI